MEPTTQTVPAEAIEAYNQYIHGHIDRRGFMTRINAIAATSVAATAMIEALTPNYAAAQKVAPTDPRLKIEKVTVPSPNGTGSIRGVLARPAGAGTNKLPSILVVHENRGLNPHIEDVARRLALENFMTFAPDGLTSVGGYPGDDDQGGQLFAKVDRTKMAEDLYTAAVWLKSRPDSTGKLGVTGFCFGGGISNALAVRMGSDLAAAVPFYGGGPPAADVPKIKAAVLVHPRRHRQAARRCVARVRSGAEGGGREVRRPHLSRCRPRLQQRRDARPLQPGGVRGGDEAHDRVVQHVRAGMTRQGGLTASARLRRVSPKRSQGGYDRPLHQLSSGGLRGPPFSVPRTVSKSQYLDVSSHELQSSATARVLLCPGDSRASADQAQRIHPVAPAES